MGTGTVHCLRLAAVFSCMRLVAVSCTSPVLGAEATWFPHGPAHRELPVESGAVDGLRPGVGRGAAVDEWLYRAEPASQRVLWSHPRAGDVSR